MIIPHRNAFITKEAYWFNVSIRLVIIIMYIFIFFASVYYDSTILSLEKPIVLKIGKQRYDRSVVFSK